LGDTPLLFAWTKPEISQILIDHGAEVDLANKVRNWMKLDEEMRNVEVLRW